jgi:hypothetical protein
LQGFSRSATIELAEIGTLLLKYQSNNGVN